MAEITASDVHKTVRAALAAWDAGQPVVSVSMGGLGDAYEHAIQTLAFDALREFLAAADKATIADLHNNDVFQSTLRDIFARHYRGTELTGNMVAAAECLSNPNRAAYTGAVWHGATGLRRT